jgi:hypothetical protein
MQYVKSFKFSSDNFLNEEILLSSENDIEKIKELFSDPEKLENEIYKNITNNNDIKMFNNKNIKKDEIIFIFLKSEENNVILCAKKLCDLDNELSLYLLIGCNDENVIKSFTGDTNIESLSKNEIMIIIKDIVKEKPLEIKIFKNIMKDEKSYVSQFPIAGVIKETNINLK